MTDPGRPGSQPASSPPERRGLKTFGIVLAASFLSGLAVLGVASLVLFPDRFTPVELNSREAEVLEAKLERLDSGRATSAVTRSGDQQRLEPEPYTEAAADREVIFTERELNAILARNSELATRLVIDLSDDLASAKLLIPLDEEFPLLGGETLRVNAGLSIAMRDGRPMVKLKGVSLWGVPIPNAWLGNMKNVDLVEEFREEEGFWSHFAGGVEDFKITEGRLRVRLRE